jgi:hypothetical protein
LPFFHIFSWQMIFHLCKKTSWYPTFPPIFLIL